jgi:hypothetical protein
MFLCLFIASSIFRPPATPGPYQRDFEAYYAAGATFNADGDPYSRAIWETEKTIAGVDPARDELLPYVGPAAALPIFSMLARIPHPQARIAWMAILSAAFLVLVICALRLAKAPRDPLLWATAALFTFVSAPMISALALGQVALLSAAALALAIIFYPARNAVGAGLSTLIAAVQPNLAIALIARMRSRWDITIATIATAIFILFTIAAGHGINGIIAYIHRLSAHGGAERFITIQHTPTAIFYSLGIAPDTAITIGTTIAIATIIITAVTILRAKLDPTTATLFTFATLPLAIPFFHEHDFVLELIPLIILAIQSSKKTRAAAAIAAILILIDWLGLAQRPPANAQIIALGASVALGFIALGNPNRKDHWYSLAGVTALIICSAIALPLAHQHPAPTWPDTLPLHFQAPPNADASAVWGNEQHESGLDAIEPTWGILRAMPLIGCILLAICIVTESRRKHHTNPALQKI